MTSISVSSPHHFEIVEPFLRCHSDRSFGPHCLVHVAQPGVVRRRRVHSFRHHRPNRSPLKWALCSIHPSPRSRHISMTDGRILTPVGLLLLHLVRLDGVEHYFGDVLASWRDTRVSLGPVVRHCARVSGILDRRRGAHYAKIEPLWLKEVDTMGVPALGGLAVWSPLLISFRLNSAISVCAISFARYSRLILVFC